MIQKKANQIFEFRRRVKGDECWFKPGYFFCYWTNAQVFKTQNENYFLHLNAAAGYAEKIEVITEAEVKELIKKLDPDKYLELFSNVKLEEA